VNAPTICYRCIHCNRPPAFPWDVAFYSLLVEEWEHRLPRCKYGCHRVSVTNYVTGQTWAEWAEELRLCREKNVDGKCPDYEDDQNGIAAGEVMFVKDIDPPKKHWWQR
jgi:hypothetical protein